MHVTLRSRFTPLRSQHVFPTVRLAIVRVARRDPKQFRVVAFSVQRDHVHLVVEARDKRALSSGVRSVSIRVARYVNDLLSRRGPLWADRWYGRALASPREVRRAFVYVLANARKHQRRPLRPGLDPYSSAPWFDGWRDWRTESGVPPPFAVPPRFAIAYPNPPTPGDRATRGTDAPSRHDFAPRTWLARTGWRKHGLLVLDEKPA